MTREFAAGSRRLDRGALDTQSQAGDPNVACDAARRHWQTVGKGLAIGYRRGKHGGTWYVRLARPGNRYELQSIGMADDHREADGETVFDYFQAQDRARTIAGQLVRGPNRYTVSDAIRDYLAWAEVHRRGHDEMKRCGDVYILPSLGTRPLVQAALLTGARWGELIRTEVRDYNADAATLHLPYTKNGKPRHVPLTDEGVKFFGRQIAGRPREERMFLKSGKAPWGKSHQNRPMDEARKKAGLLVSFHDLRHTYGSLLAMQGVSLQVIAELLAHADTRITEKHYAHLRPSYVAETLRKNLPSFGLEQDNVATLKP